MNNALQHSLLTLITIVLLRSFDSDVEVRMLAYPVFVFGASGGPHFQHINIFSCF